MKGTVITIILTALYLFCHHAFAGYGATLCKTDPQYTCYKVKKGESWDKLYPDADKKDMMTKLNRTNLSIHKGMIIAVPVKQDVTVMEIAPMQKQIEAPGEKVIYVSLKQLAWGAYDEQGNLVNWGPVSGGKGYCPDIGRGCHTATGRFAIYNKEGAGCKSTKFPVGRGGAPMPYCMFFHGGFALHGSYEVPGYNASHGCVRMFVSDAKWLNQEFVKQEKVKVIVKSQKDE
jgi:L,D-transpeptidase ErfK/SrfK